MYFQKNAMLDHLKFRAKWNSDQDNLHKVTQGPADPTLQGVGGGWGEGEGGLRGRQIENAIADTVSEHYVTDKWPAQSSTTWLPKPKIYQLL